MKESDPIHLQCPIPKTTYEQILKAHGGGGRMTQHLIRELFMAALGNEILEQGHDGAKLPPLEGELAFSTDSFVVDPIFFPGGNIGDLAVKCTCNVLLGCGAEPRDPIAKAITLEAAYIVLEVLMIVHLAKKRDFMPQVVHQIL